MMVLLLFAKTAFIFSEAKSWIWHRAEYEYTSSRYMLSACMLVILKRGSVAQTSREYDVYIA
jgi:hypothetical protein